jgi:hypothetical protein
MTINLNASANNNLIEQLTMPNALMPEIAISGNATSDNTATEKSIMSGGQPTVDDLKRLQANGFSTVINLRPAAEMAGNNEAEQVDAMGLD